MKTKPADLIMKKRDQREFSAEEIDELIRMVVDGTMSDAQIGAILMAIFLNGLSIPETVNLTKCMIQSGETLQWDKDWKGLLVDKHSTGGVGDKVSLVLTPALAACGLKVPMISGRGLSYTGGTLDKLESIPGYQVTRTPSQILSQLDSVGACIVGQTNSLVPADKILYSIRDTTGTVENPYLIATSIMSKKAAEGIDALVLEVTFGKAAPMKTEKDARELARIMVDMGDGLGISTTALLTRMDNPVGRSVGNALEVAEAVQCLHGSGPPDLVQLTCKLGGELLQSTGNADTAKKGAEIIEKTLQNGSARRKFIDMVCSQGVDREDANALCNQTGFFSDKLPAAKHKTEFTAKTPGYVHEIDAMSVGCTAHRLGAGRLKSGDPINYAVGVKLHAQVGDFLNEGDVWAVVHHDTPDVSAEDRRTMENALRVRAHPPTPEDLQLVTERIAPYM